MFKLKTTRIPKN